MNNEEFITHCTRYLCETLPLQEPEVEIPSTEHYHFLKVRNATLILIEMLKEHLRVNDVKSE